MHGFQARNAVNTHRAGLDRFGWFAT